MKKYISFLAPAFLCFGLATASAQLGKPGGAAADSAMLKVFGTNLNFSANMNVEIKMPAQDNDITMPGKIYFLQGKSRTEMDMTQMKGSKMPPHAADQMKAMGMDKMISISRPDTKNVYLIYPGLESYTKLTVDKSPTDTSDTKIAKTELGKETLDGHPCAKNKYSVTNPDTGENLTMVAWTAADLKNYPIKIQIDAPEATKGSKTPVSTTLHFTDLDTASPAASLFEPPVGYHVYTDVQAMVQTEMMKKMAGANGMPPGHPAMPADHSATPTGHP